VIDDHEALMHMMCTRAVRYLMVFPDQRPAGSDDPRLGTETEYDSELGKTVIKPLFRTESPHAAEAGGANMIIYAMNWPALCP
jgi:hypothetical protein